MSIILWVDDLRDPYAIMGYGNECVWTKDYNESIEKLDDLEKDITHISLDNDLGDENEPQGRDVFNVIEEYLYNGKLQSLKLITVHSDNSSAVRYMMSAKEMFKEKYGITIKQTILSRNDYN